MKKVKLAELGKIVGGATPSTKIDKYWDGDISWITPKDMSIQMARHMETGERKITEEGVNSCSTMVLPKNSVLFTSRAPIGYVAIANKPICTNQGFKSIIVDTRVADYKYVYYLLKHNKDYIASHGSGTTFMEVSGAVMRNIEVIIQPNIEEQRKIAKILSSIDDKIENNNAISKNLEEMAAALYKRWFVNFEFPNEDGEPYKSSGGEFIDSELGMIPKGWTAGIIDECVSLKGGGTPSTKIEKYWDGDINWVTPKDLSNSKITFLNITERKITKEGVKHISSGVLPLETILLSSRAPIGYVNITNIETACNQGFIAVICNGIFPLYYMYFWIQSNMDIIISSANGSTFLEISKKSFRSITVIIPDVNLLKAFNYSVNATFDLILNNEKENARLAELRDNLLPKLMNGEIDVENVEI